MPVDFARFRADAEDVEREVVRPIRMAGRVLAFDQTLGATGYAVLDVVEGIIAVREVGMVPTNAGQFTGHEGNLVMALQIRHGVKRLLEIHQPVLVGHEMPPVGGGRLMRPDSSLMAAEAIRISADDMAIPVAMKAPQSIKRRLTGNGTADKKEVRVALDRMFPTLAQMKPRNDNTYDAVGVGVLTIEEAP
jgi:Holliday junction resolvasome RuvABC endonuclease subunit